MFKANPEKLELVSHVQMEVPGETPPQPLLRYPAWAAPVLSHGLLYVRGEGRLVCLEAIPEKPEPGEAK